MQEMAPYKMSKGVISEVGKTEAGHEEITSALFTYYIRAGGQIWKPSQVLAVM